MVLVSISCANGADDDLFWMYFTVSSDDVAPVGGNVEGGGVTAGGVRENSSGAEDGNGQHGHSNGAKGDGDKGDPVGRGLLAGGGAVGAGGVERVDDGNPRLAGGGGSRGSSGGGDDGDRTEAGCHSSVGDGRGAVRLTVVSNDEMRNHRMALLEPVPFKR